ncbi:MAG: hypothetical protein JNK57_07555 [Planctomycetaceae bacterium]|nr:hypothetical protein [Planctomycetaceae bacterium]
MSPKPTDSSGSLREPLLDRGAIQYIPRQDGRGSLREPWLDRGAIHYIRVVFESGGSRFTTPFHASPAQVTIIGTPQLSQGCVMARLGDCE